MLRSARHSIVACALIAPGALAQVNASYATFGAGCNGTGIGLGAMHIVPAAAATSFGAGNGIPFGWSPNRFQQVFLGSELPAAFTMAALSLRQPNRPPAAHSFTVDLDIKVGYTTRSLATLGTTFDANWDAGPPVTVAPRAQFVFPDQPPTPSTSPTDFQVTLPWSSTFAWTPAPGRNLLIEVTVYGNSWGNGIYGYALDNLGGTQALWGTPATAATGVLRGFGPAIGLVEETHTAVPRLYSNNTPQIGDTFRVRVSQAAASSFALMTIGRSDTWWNGIALPYDLGRYGAPGCALLAAADGVNGMQLDASGAGFVVYTLPNSIYLLSMLFYNQVAVVDPAANALGLATSNGGVGLIGNQ
jgi:hypothetical protein